MSLTIDHANPTLQITAENGYIIENEVLHKIGKTTGWTYGAVEDACADYEFDGWVRQCSDRVDYSRGPGDSGSPVFSLRSDGTVALRGIHFGYVIPPYGDALMSNIHRVEMDLGGLTVFDSGTPNVSIFGPTEVPSGTYCRWDASVTGGIPPYSYEWFGLLSGSNPTVEGFVTSSDGLSVTVTDHLGRSRTASISVTVVEGNGGIIC